MYVGSENCELTAGDMVDSLPRRASQEERDEHAFNMT
jgi:hypothetical protein